MLTALVRLILRRPVEATGVVMGDFEMINLTTGARLRIDKDGSELRDEVIPPAIEWCDKGQHYAPKMGGRDDYNILWICLACQS
jgi:hypothetical protein